MSLTKQFLKISELKALASTIKEQGDPCWDGFKQVGMKDEKGVSVPNCVPKDENHVDREEHGKRTRRDEDCGCDHDKEEE